LDSDVRKQIIGVLATSLFTLSWFRFKPLYNADMGLGSTVGHTPPSYIFALAKANFLGLSPWVYPGTRMVPSALLYTFTVNLLHVFTPLWFSQFVYVYVLALFAEGGVCALIGRVSGSAGLRPPWWVGLVAGVFYVYAPYYQFFVGDGAYIPLGFYASYPFMVYSSLGLTELGGDELSHYLKNLVILLVAFFVGSGGFTYYYYLTGLGSLLLIGVVYSLVRRRGWFGWALGLGGLLLGLTVAQLSLAPVIVGDFVSGPTLAQSNTTSPNLLILFMRRTTQTTYFHELTQNFWPAPGPFGAPQSNVPAYLTSPLIGVAFLAILLALLFLGSDRRRSANILKAVAPFLAAYFVVVALAAGPEKPFGPIVVYAFVKLWFMRAITESFTSLNFIFQLSLAVMLGLALTQAKTISVEQKRPKAGTLGVALLILVAATLAAPYAVGAPLPRTQLVAAPNGVEQTYNVTPRVQIPGYFTQLVSYTNSLPPHGAVLLLPVGGNFRTTSWYIAVDALSSALTKPVVGGGYVSTPQTQALIDLIDMWEGGANISLQPLLERMGVGYIIVEGDAASAPPYTPEPPFNLNYIESQLNSTPNIKLLQRFGPDLVYRVSWETNTEWGAQPTLAYGFSTYVRGVVAQPAPQNPFSPLFNMSSATPVPGHYSCMISGGHLYLSLEDGYAQCGFTANITSANPIYVSYAYQPTLTSAGVTLKRSSGGPPISGQPIVQGTIDGLDYAVAAFPPGSYRGLEVYVAGSPSGLAVMGEVDWVYASLAALPGELAGYNTQSSTLFVTPPTGGVVAPRPLLNSSMQPRVDTWACSAYTCTVNLRAGQPFFYVYYTGYSDLYTLYVNGEPDGGHYAAYGSFNAWLVNATGNLTLRVTYTNPLLPYEALSVGVWVIAGTLYLLYLSPWSRGRKLGANRRV